MKKIIYILMFIVLLGVVNAGFWGIEEFTTFEDPKTVTIAGTVTDVLGNPINNTYVEYTNPKASFSTRTNVIGEYSIALPRGVFQLLISKTGYRPHIEVVSYNEDKTFYPTYQLHEEFSNCNSDCTRGNADICDRTCQGYNECSFDSTALEVCDPWGESGKGFKKGALVYSNNNDVVKCCKDAPIEISDEKQTDITVENAENVIVTERVVMFRGNPVKLKVVVFQ